MSSTAKNIVRNWTWAGIPVLLVLGTLLHFVYGWTGSSRAVGAFVPVNESVWEHLKMGYWALTLFSVFEYPKVSKFVRQYFLAKLVGVLVLELTILLIFYTYTLFTHQSIIYVDIGSYVAGVCACQVVVYRIYQAPQDQPVLNLSGLAGYLLLAVLFAVWTYSPPKGDIFMDHRDSSYGIYRTK